jgi:hypothetical protein
MDIITKKIRITENQLKFIVNKVVNEVSNITNTTTDGISYTFKEVFTEPKINHKWIATEQQYGSKTIINYTDSNNKLKMRVATQKNGSKYYKSFDTNIITRVSDHWSWYFLRDFVIKDIFDRIVTTKTLIWGTGHGIGENRKSFYNIILDPKRKQDLQNINIEPMIKTKNNKEHIYVMNRNFLNLIDNVNIIGIFHNNDKTSIKVENKNIDLFEQMIKDEEDFIDMFNF